MKKQVPAKGRIRSGGLLFLTCFFLLAHSKIIFAQWGPIINLTPNSISAGLNENAGPCLAISGDTLHVVWSDRHASGGAIYYKRSQDRGLTWSVDTPITDTTMKASMPAIAVFGSSVHVVWMDTLLGVRASCYKRSLDGGNTWGATVVVDSSTTFWPGVAAYDSLVILTINKNLVVGNTEVYIMRSLDNGTTWGLEQQISNAPNRSEDPAIAILGSYVHLSWNDKRSGTMEIYYCRSSDQGVTWGPETPLTSTDSYTSMVSLNGPNVDVPFGMTLTGNFDPYIRQSQDTGQAFIPTQPLSSDTSTEAYPYMVRDNMNLHLLYYRLSSSAGPWYLYSGDGGNTWAPPFQVGTGGQGFIGYTGTALHVIWPYAGHVYYRTNPTGNRPATSGVIPMTDKNKMQLNISPNPFTQTATINFILSENSRVTIKIYDIEGREVRTLMDGYQKGNTTTAIEFDASNLAPGTYFCRLVAAKFCLTEKMILMDTLSK